MKQKHFKAVSVMTVLLILVILAGCSKADKMKNANTEASGDKVTDTTQPEAAASDNKDTIAETEGTSSADAVTSDDNAAETKESAAEADNTSDAMGAASGETEDNSTSGDSTEASGTSGGSAEDGNTADEETMPVQETVSTEEGIKDIFEQNSIKAGTCLSDIMLAQEKYKDLITGNFDSITLENYMKPDYILNKSASIEKGEIVVEFTKKTTQLLDWAKSNGLSARGHVLVWYSQTPDWIFYKDFDNKKKLVDRDTMLARMESYIKQTFEQLEVLGYSDLFYGYDVVNEALMEDGSYRDCLWKQVIGDDYVWCAFSYADKYAPENIKLYYNDYNEQFKTDYIVKLAKSLVDETGRSLIDGIGCQGHLYTKDSIDQYISTLKAFSSLGLDVQITELDVSLGTWQNILDASEENLKTQGQYYYELISRIVAGNKAGDTCVSAITFWGFADNLSWRGQRSPLLFDGSLSPQYAYFGAKMDKAHAGY